MLVTHTQVYVVYYGIIRRQLAEPSEDYQGQLSYGILVFYIIPAGKRCRTLEGGPEAGEE